MPIRPAKAQHRTIAIGLITTGNPERHATDVAPTQPYRAPISSPSSARMAASVIVRNCRLKSRRRAPTVIRMAISGIRSVRMMFMMLMSPTISAADAIDKSRQARARIPSRVQGRGENRAARLSKPHELSNVDRAQCPDQAETPYGVLSTQRSPLIATAVRRRLEIGRAANAARLTLARVAYPTESARHFMPRIQETIGH